MRQKSVGNNSANVHNSASWSGCSYRCACLQFSLLLCPAMTLTTILTLLASVLLLGSLLQPVLPLTAPLLCCLHSIMAKHLSGHQLWASCRKLLLQFESGGVQRSCGSIDGFLCSPANSSLGCFTNTFSLERPVLEIALPLFPVCTMLFGCAGENSFFLLCILSIRCL